MDVFEECDSVIREYLLKSSSEFSYYKKQSGLFINDSSEGSQIHLMETQRVSMTASHSREQRNLFSTMISKLDEASRDSQIFDMLLDHLVEIERIWCLCEIFQFHQQGKLLSLNFARWLYETRRKDADAALSFFLTLEKPECHSSGVCTENGTIISGYWGTLHAFALQGDLGIVWDLLCLHSEFPRIDIASTGEHNSTHYGREFALEL